MEPIRRIPPCPEYDVEGRQAWYEAMAAEGYRLSEFGKLYVYFVPDTPKQVRYRLQPNLNTKGPAPEEIALAEEFGWKHLGNHSYFSIFRTEDPDARELNTDPQVQATVIHRLLRRILRTHLIILLFLSPAIWIFFRYPLAFLTDNTMLLNWLLVPALAIGVWNTVDELIHLYRLRRQLKLGEPLSPDKPQKLRNKHYQALRLADFILLILLLLVAHANNRWLPWEKLRWNAVEEPLPFADLTDLSLGSTYAIGDWHVEHNNEAADRSTLLCREQMQYQQYGYLHHTDGTVSNCWYTVDYYDLRTKGLARALFRQLRDEDANNLFFRSRYEVLPLEELPVDQAHFYRFNRPTLLLQNGTEVLRVEFNQLEVDEHYGSYETTFLPAEQWTMAVAESLTE